MSAVVNAQRIVITGAAGLVGQNMVPRLKARGYRNLVGIDKHRANTPKLKALHQDMTVVEADLAKPGAWADTFAGADVLVINHAQIGGLIEEPFIANNVTATSHVLDAAKFHSIPYIVHISSSVVTSMARDCYTETKKAQEKLVLESGIPCCVLRPTLMFGWFDRKHLGWLARFMHRVPVFPIPGHGRYLRQPLYVGDLCSIIASVIDQPRPGEFFNISGRETIDYIDLMREVRAATGATAPIVKVPYVLFWLLLSGYAVVDRNPPFTTKQLKALVTPDVFEVIDWPAIFGIRATPLADALNQTFRDSTYSDIVLDF